MTIPDELSSAIGRGIRGCPQGRVAPEMSRPPNEIIGT